MSTPISRSVRTRKDERPYFDVGALPDIANFYVAWIDLMGAQSIMRRALGIATNFVMKIHVSCQEVLVSQADDDLDLFPMIDGVYVVTSRQRPLQSFLKGVLAKLALLFILEENPLYRFLVRGAIAFGPLVKGDQTLGCSKALEAAPDYSKRIALGIPLSQAYYDERNAAPFGIYIHESARAFAPPGDQPMGGTHWKWWLLDNEAKDNELVHHLRAALVEYYGWAEAHATTLLYERDRMRDHLALVHEYFGS